MNKFGYDEVNGIVIGGFDIAFIVTYDNIPQSQKMYAESEEEAIKMSREYIKNPYAEYRNLSVSLTPWKDKNKWDVRIYN
jgi:hypothetical protein